MGTIIKIAWRNIWRDKRRARVLIATVAISILGLLETKGFFNGFSTQRIDSFINIFAGHIQIAKKGYHNKPSVYSSIANRNAVEDVLSSISSIKYSPRVIIQALASSDEASLNVVIHGIDPQREQDVTVISQLIEKGVYLSQNSSDKEVLIGEDLAHQLGIDVGEKIVLMANNSLDNNIVAEAFQIVGIFKSISKDFNKTSVFITLHDAQKLIGYVTEVSVYSIRLNPQLKLQPKVQQLKKHLEQFSLEVVSWKQRFPMLAVSMELFDFYVFLFYIILITAVAFSLINSFLMIVSERMREFGIMMAVGILPRKIRTMLIFESIFVTLIGMVLGTIAALTITTYLESTGVDLSLVAQNLAELGIDTTLYPNIYFSDIVFCWLATSGITTLAVLYPSTKATRIEIVDAINFI